MNDNQIDLPMRIDPTSGRVQFQKVSSAIFRNMLGKLETCLILLTFLMTKGYRTDQVQKRGE